MVNRQAQPLWRDAQFHSSRGAAREGGQLLPRRHPLQALSGSIVQKHLDQILEDLGISDKVEIAEE